MGQGFGWTDEVEEPPFELPAAFRAADATSLRGQRLYLLLTRCELVMVFLGAAAGFIGGLLQRDRLGGLLGAALFVGALVVRTYKASESPQVAWHGGRALAESTKTLAWRYVVGGLPLPVSLPPAQADRVFIERLVEILSRSNTGILADTSDVGPQITPSMRELRRSSLAHRRDVYERRRVDDQLRWYAGRSAWNVKRHRRWNRTLVALEVLGVAAGTATAAGLRQPEVDWLSIVAAGTAAVAAWLQARQHGVLAASYALAAQELASIRALVAHQENEEAWASFVSSSEGAVSREHTMWRAARTQ